MKLRLSDVLVDEGGMFERERKQFACLIAFYVGNLSGGDLDYFTIMEKCIRIAEHYDFYIEEPFNPDDPEEEILLDASAAKNAAYGFAEEIIKHKY